MKLSKETRLISIGVLVILSLIFLAYPLLIKKQGVVIISISEDSACKEVLVPGSSITKINGKNIENSNDFYSAADGLSGKINLIVNGGPRVCTIEGDESLDIRVSDFEKSGIKFGVDIKEGKKITLESQDIENDLKVIETRSKILGLTNINIGKTKNQINIIFGSAEEKVEKLLESGIVSVKFVKVVEMENQTGELLLADNSYDLIVNNNTLKIESDDYQTGDKFVLESIDVEIQNITQNYTTFYLNIFDDQDVDPSDIGENKRVFQNQGSYIFVLDVAISDQAAERFAKITRDQPITINPQGENYLRDPLVVFVDGEIITTVPVSRSEAGKEVSRINLWGVERTSEDANRKLDTLETFLKSGRLTDIEVIERTTSKPEKEGLIAIVGYFVAAVVIVSVIYNFIKFKEPKLAGLSLVVFGTELLIILGVLSSQAFTIILLTTCIIFSAIKNRTETKLKWVSILTMFIIGFGAVVNQLIIDFYTLAGISFGFLVNLGYFIVLNQNLRRSRKKYEKLLEMTWKVSPFFLLGLLVIFFLQDYKNFSIASSILIMVNLVLTKPEYVRLSRKLK